MVNYKYEIERQMQRNFDEVFKCEINIKDERKDLFLYNIIYGT